MKTNQKIDINKKELQEYMQSHSVNEAVNYFNASKTTLYVRCREYGIKTQRTKIPQDVLKECLQVCPLLTCSQAYELYGEPYGLRDRGFRALIKRSGVKFKPVDRSSIEYKRSKETGAKYRVPIDEEHLKANAHLYTCKEYYNKFKPSCARTTLFYRAKELGLCFKKSTDFRPFILEFGEECLRTGKTWEEFRNLFAEKFPNVSISHGQYLLHSQGIHLKATPRVTDVCEFDRRLIFLLYPYIGSSCRDYLIEKRPVTAIRNWASRHNITKLRNSFNGRSYCYSGRSFKTRSLMIECILKDAGISIEDTGFNKGE